MLGDFIAPDEVLRHSGNWVEIPHDRAFIRRFSEPVILVRNAHGGKHAERFGFMGGLTDMHDLADAFFETSRYGVLKFYVRKKLDKKRFAKYMLDTWGKEGSKSQHACAHAVQLGLHAGGFDTSGRPQQSKTSHDWACFYGPFLRVLGAAIVDRDGYVGSGEQVGDVVVFQAVKGHSAAGHIEMWDGNEWVSDFRQNHFSPYSGFNEKNLDFTVYRFPN
jgi:hypothetical protein